MLSPWPSAIAESGYTAVEPRPAQVQLDGGPGHVGDEQVERRDPLEQPQSAGEPAGLVGQRRHRELRDVGRAARPAARCAAPWPRASPRARRASRSAGSARCVGSGAMHRRRPGCRGCPVCSSVRIETGTAATSGPAGNASWSCSQRAQRAGAQRHHDVVDGDAGGVLDRLDLGERHAAERPAPVRADVPVERRRGRTSGGADRIDVAAAAQQEPVDQRQPAARAGPLTSAGNERTISVESRAARTGWRASDSALRASSCTAPGSALRPPRAAARRARAAPARCPAARRAGRFRTPRRSRRGAPWCRGPARPPCRPWIR